MRFENIANFLESIFDVKELSSNQRESIIDEAINKLSELYFSIDKQKFKGILRRVSFFSANLTNYSSGRAFYHMKTNSIYYDEMSIISDKVSSKRIRLHEIIHALSGKKAFFDDYMKMLRTYRGS
ncbi:MAG: hypothetical protein HFJ50_00405 [Clostridia bacterium]|jgi:hypothetical protein|nr:hypothetical protein [Clostridia bacterium]